MSETASEMQDNNYGKFGGARLDKIYLIIYNIYYVIKYRVGMSVDIIVVLNQKSEVGKSTTAHALRIGLANKYIICLLHDRL